MNNRHLHIVSFDVPYPPNYGGAIDVYYRIKALHTLGVDITLHCFVYNDRKENRELNKLCKQVNYYQRDTSIVKQFHTLPYSVVSRKNNSLLNNLLKDNDPILFEGLMSCYYLNHTQLKSRLKLFREANIEHDYYYALYKSSKSPRKKIYYWIESVKLKKFEKKLSAANILFPISQTDELYFLDKFGSSKIKFIPCFHPNERVISKEGASDYILYHGNLSVSENESAAIYLCRNIFGKLKFPCIIAGMNPSQLLIKTAEEYKNINVISNPDFDAMSGLIENAQINILVSFQATGMKIKLLNTLFMGRHIVANNVMLQGTGLAELCHIANTPDKQIEVCNTLIDLPFTKKDMVKRENLLFPQYDNIEQAKKIIKEF